MITGDDFNGYLMMMSRFHDDSLLMIGIHPKWCHHGRGWQIPELTGGLPLGMSTGCLQQEQAGFELDIHWIYTFTTGLWTWKQCPWTRNRYIDPEAGEKSGCSWPISSIYIICISIGVLKLLLQTWPILGFGQYLGRQKALFGFYVQFHASRSPYVLIEYRTHYEYHSMAPGCWIYILLMDSMYVPMYLHIKSK